MEPLLLKMTEKVMTFLILKHKKQLVGYKTHKKCQNLENPFLRFEIIFHSRIVKMG